MNTPKHDVPLSDVRTDAARNALPDLPHDEEGPVFSQPWQAEVFSLACALHENGLFSWSEWAETLAAVIKEMPEDTEYYQCWLTALERISINKELVDDDSLSERHDAWDRAARATPHGKVIKLGVENG